MARVPAAGWSPAGLCQEQPSVLVSPRFGVLGWGTLTMALLGLQVAQSLRAGLGCPQQLPVCPSCPHPSPTFLAELGGDAWPQAPPGVGSGWGSAHRLTLTWLLWPRRHHKKALRAVAFHRHYPLFASGSDDGTVIVCHGMVYK